MASPLVGYLDHLRSGRTISLVVSVPQRKLMARYLLEHYAVSQRRACRLARLPRKTFRYVSKRPSQ